jgi:signal peptidase I
MSDSSNLARSAAAAPVIPGPDRRGDGKKKPTMGPIRVNLEAFGVAILAAVLLKWFCIEAYQIPTSSMQPTLMGDVAASVYDRILVDKLLPTFREPQRWDITVFGYPLQKNQNYVKRLVGMPGDRLRIAGGNIYQVVDAGDGKRTFRIERKPDDLQAAMWKNVFPARQLARAEAKALGPVFGASPSSAASETDAGFTLTLGGGSARLFFRDEPDGGMVDRVWDGYPEAVARAIRAKNPLDQPQEIVPDVRIAAAVTPEQALDELAFELEVMRPGFDKWTFALVVKGGKGTLQVRAKDSKVEAQSPEFPCEVAAGDTTELAFAHVDDRLLAWRDGTEIARLDTDAFACRDGCVLPFDAATGKLALPAGQKVTPQFACRGKGKVRLEQVRIDRDQHYTQSTAPDLIEVPADHYYMLGDNTLQSIDSRGWTAIEIGVDAAGNVVPPDTGVRNVRGNKRAMPLANPPDRDETPIALPNEKAIVMIDEYGEILRLGAEVGPDWGKRIAFQRPGSTDGNGEWLARELPIGNTRGISFVPRGDIRGRAVMVFYPCRPLSWLFLNNWPDRFGFVR